MENTLYNITANPTSVRTINATFSNSDVSNIVLSNIGTTNDGRIPDSSINMPKNDDVSLRKTRRGIAHSRSLNSKAFCKTLCRFLGRNFHSPVHAQDSHLTSNNNLSSIDHVSLHSHDSVTDLLKTTVNIPAFLRARKHNSRVMLNVGGERHEVMWKTLRRLPLSRLGRLSLSNSPDELIQLFDDYSVEKNELYFDRYARSFGSILSVYRTGHLHFLEDICVLAFKNDLFYWGVNEYQLETCCFYKYYQKKEQVEEELKKTREISMSQAQEEQFGTGKWATLQKHVWDLVEKPQTSMAARSPVLAKVCRSNTQCKTKPTDRTRRFNM
ncbi:unnamed protein product [Heterobilharzia americana]|nr:unnamed protein product [Heterobilharzia americana]